MYNGAKDGERMHESPTRFIKLYRYLLIFAAVLTVSGAAVGGRELYQGLKAIALCSDLLISDYIAIGGLGAALFNSGLVTFISIGVLYFSHDPINGFTIPTVCLMSGFALFGKNIFNIWPILIGSLLYSLVRKSHYGAYSAMGLLATTLSPTVSYIALQDGFNWQNLVMACVVGVLIGFLLPAIAEYTYKILNGMSLYNMGFAAGLLGMILIPLLIALRHEPHPVTQWATGYNLKLGIPLYLLCTALIIAGIVIGKKRGLHDYMLLLSTSGRAPEDYLRMFGPAPMMINIGVDGIIAASLLLMVGGDLNGPTIGGILGIMAFSAYGCHALNIFPVMMGVIIAEMLMSCSFIQPAAQLALLFSTTLAPFAGVFGSAFGGAAGFLHLAVVMRSGMQAQGANLYNNGFAGGVIAIVLYPLITSIFLRHKPFFREIEWMDTFEDTDDMPIPPEDDTL